jgi:hypothetical protein
MDRFNFFKKKEKPKEVITKEVHDTPKPKPRHKRYTFKVAGISFHEKEIREHLIMENDDYSMSKKEMIEMGLIDTMVYKYDGLSTNVQLVPEPDNLHSSDAIKVIADDIIIGYVPSKETFAVKELMDKDDLKIGCSFHGGDYKIIFEDYDTGKYDLKKGSNNIGAVVTLKYQQ